MRLNKPSIIAIVGIGFILALIAWNTSPQNDSNSADNATGLSSEEEATETGYTLSEIADHSTAEDCWTAIDGQVYDISSYIPRHPGGPQILRACGVDGTEVFKNLGFTDEQAVTIREMNELPEDVELHSPTARELLSQLKIGILKGE